mmetsp:Transcript_17482/g.37791  ORF Transcript_17482/g.37791 Transcript_17482/m.37791 type:complete len:483 (-) Transcript_17482:156-1604(-)
MKVCGACCNELPKESFSGKQWKLNQHQRRCNGCIEAGNPLQLSKPPTIEEDKLDEGPSCWICLQEGLNDAGQPLRRDCSCRGDSLGYAHLACLVEYADKKTYHYISEISPRQNGYIDFGVLRSGYEKCPCCYNAYENDLSVDMASAFVAFIEKHYPGRKPYRRNLLEALQLKLSVLSFMSARTSQVQREEAKRIGRKMLRIIRELQAAAPSPSEANKVARFEMAVHFMVGQIWRSEGREGAQRSIPMFERSRDLGIQLGETEYTPRAEFHLARAQEIVYGVDETRIARDVETRKSFYAQQIAEFGQDATSAITAGRNLAFTLQTANRSIEALRLFKKIGGICRRVHGEEHHLTQQINLETTERRIQVSLINETIVTVEAVRYKEGGTHEQGEDIVVKGPITSNQRIGEKEFNVPWQSVYLPLGTPVSVRCLRNATHLNGKIGDIRREDENARRYEVHFEDENLNPVLVKIENLEILFELPDL